MPDTYLLFELDLKSLRKQLIKAPLRGQNIVKPIRISFPNSAGVVEEYEVFESPILDPILAAKFPMTTMVMSESTMDRSGL